MQVLGNPIIYFLFCCHCFLTIYSCNQHNQHNRHLKEILTKSYYVFKYEIDDYPCPPHPLKSDCLNCRGRIHFYPEIILHNSIKEIKWQNNSELKSTHNFELESDMLDTYLQIAIDSVYGIKPNYNTYREKVLNIGHLHFDKIYVTSDSVLVVGGCTGRNRFIDFEIYYKGDIRKNRIKYDTSIVNIY